ncbi:MAG: hypothetical protein HQL94_01700 [Magnetococcales bacterium]|nr:hypothetical protein [Magnetococcales bacterium]MBF0438654.1 hypothetical protein [Magnetococcales bacterium]
MRLLILSLLALFTIGALYYGLRQLWYTFHPNPTDQPSPMPTWLTGRPGLVLSLLILLFMLLLALYDITSTQVDPGEHQPPPTNTTPSNLPKKPIRSTNVSPSTPDNGLRRTFPTE